ncbi:hypothetical protein NBRC116494_33780 [Aurantivibrio plasticivorans]
MAKPHQELLTSNGPLDTAYLSLSRDWDLWQVPFYEAVKRIDEAIVASLNVSRASVWLLDEPGDCLDLIDLYCSSTQTHAHDASLKRPDFRRYFEALDRTRIISAHDAHTHPDTRDLSPAYLKPNGIFSMLDATIRSKGKVSGVICVEQVGGSRLWHEYEKRFLVSIADLLSHLLIYRDTILAKQHLDRLNATQQAILDAANYSIISTDKQGVIRSFNAAAERMLGYRAEELVDKFTPEIFHVSEELDQRIAQLSVELNRKIHPRFTALVAKAALGTPDENRWTYRRKDGSTFTVLVSVTAITDRDRNISGFLSIATDTSEIDNLQSSDSRYKALVESAGVGILVIDNGLFIDCNQACLDLFGCAREQLIGAKPSKFSPEYQANGEDSNTLASKLIQRALERSVTFEWVHRRLDGSQFIAEVTLNKIQGRSKTGILGIIKDITSRKKAQQNYIEQRELLEATLNALPGFYYVIDCDGKLIHWNQNFEETLGYNEEEISNLTFQSLIHPDYHLRVTSIIEDVLKTGQEEFVEIQLRHKHQSYVTMLSGGSRIVQNDQALFVGVSIDISARKAIEEQLANSSREILNQNRSLQSIFNLSNRLNGLRSPESIANEALTELNHWHPDCTAQVLLINRKRKSTIATYTQGTEAKSINSVDNDILFTILGISNDAGNESTFFKDALSNPLLAQTIAANKTNTQSIAALKLVHGDNILGALILWFNEPQNFYQGEKETYIAISKTISMAIANADYVADMSYRANHDSLTELANRTLLHETFDHWINNQPTDNSAALFLIDLDRFKEVNDALGHHTGDQLLKMVASRLVSIFEESALNDESDVLVARLGGDEFALLLCGNENKRSVEIYANRILSALEQPFHVMNIDIQIGGSIGLATFPEHGKDSHELLRAADVAMYKAKQDGLGFVLYNANYDLHTPERLRLMSDLRQAIQERQFVLHYQPKYAIGSSRHIIGFEALVRWQHPELGLMYPDSFIALVEMTDLIVPFTDVIIEAALSQQAAWKKSGYRFSVAVNLSARNLVGDHCFHTIKSLMDRFDTKPGELDLEITETALMLDPDHAVDLLQRISHFGVAVSIDDFGTGYSSLAYLRRLPIKALKIDREFVTDLCTNPQDEVIVRSTIGLAHNLGLAVVAEGIEDQQTLDLLHELGCDQAQGYYLSKPFPFSHFEDTLPLPL